MLDIARAIVAHRILVVPKIRTQIPVENRQRVRDATRAVFIWTSFFSDLLGVTVDFSSLAQYALLIPVADDLVDREGKSLTVQDLENSKTAQVMVAKARSPKFKDVLLKAMEAQSSTLRQRGFRLSKSELEDLTFQKGGLSMLAALHFITLPSRRDEEVFYFIGSALQVFDDYQDQDIDQKEGISTLFTSGYYNRNDVWKWFRSYEQLLTETYGLKALRLILFTRFSLRLADFHNSYLV